MRPRGQTPRMREFGSPTSLATRCFNEAAGADPADALQSKAGWPRRCPASMRPRGQTPRMRPGSRSSSPTAAPCFNEAAGADPADAPPAVRQGGPDRRCFNEAAGADPADAAPRGGPRPVRGPASMRPRGQTPRMRERDRDGAAHDPPASMRPRGQTPRMPRRAEGCSDGVRVHASMRPRGQTPRMPIDSAPLLHRILELQ